MINVRDIAYVRFRAPDLDVMEQYLLDFGLIRSARTDRALYMRGADPAHHLHITELGEPAYVGHAFYAAGAVDLLAISKAGGASPIENVAEPGGGKRVTLTDPDGFRVEIVHGIEELQPLHADTRHPINQGSERTRRGEFVRLKGGPVTVKRLGHVVLFVSDFAASDSFYKSHFGFLDSDEVVSADGHRKIAAFERCDRGDEYVDHHTLMLTEAERAGFNHAGFEVENIDAVMLGHKHLASKGYQHVWGIGRHVLGSQIFDYWNDPYGNRLEHWTDGDLLRACHPPGRVDRAGALRVQWGPELKR